MLEASGPTVQELFVMIICSFLPSILEEINLVSKLIIMGPNSNVSSIISNSAAKGRSKNINHEFESQKDVEVVILDEDSKMLWMFCWTCPYLLT